MKEITKFENDFEGNKVEIIRGKNGEPLFEIYSTGKALGYARSNGKSAGEHGVHPKLFPYKSRIDTVIKNAEITPCVHNGHKYITESQLYDFMLEARTDKCRKFRKWVTNEVLPSIIRTGSYSISNAKSTPFAYVNKTFHGRPVVTISDIVNIYEMNNVTLYNHVKKNLLCGRDYDLLTGESLKDYTAENPHLPRCRRSVFVIYNTGLSRIVNSYNLDVDKTPKFMIEKTGYVVNESVRNLMSFVRREIKGIEALTYLLESDDSPHNLENYRKTLFHKLSALKMWQIDVKYINLNLHQTTASEYIDILHNEYGLK